MARTPAPMRHNQIPADHLADVEALINAYKKGSPEGLPERLKVAYRHGRAVLALDQAEPDCPCFWR